MAVGRAHHGKSVYAVSLAWKHRSLRNKLNAQPHCSFCRRQWRCRKVTPMSLLLTKAVVTIIILQKAQLPKRGATPGKKKIRIFCQVDQVIYSIITNRYTKFQCSDSNTDILLMRFHYIPYLQLTIDLALS